jgi:hypothetical protein
MDDEGKLYERPIGTISKRNLDKKRDDFLKRYISLIMNTRIVSDTTKLYIKSTLPSVASVIASYNQTVSEDEQINIKTAQSKIDYDSNKLLKYFPDNMISQVLSNSSCNLNDYERRLNLAVVDYGKKNKLLDNLMLRLPKVEVQDNLDEDKFTEFISMIAPYFKKHIKYLEDNLPKNAVGYMMYLMSTPQLSGEHKERYNLLKEMLE